MGSPTASPIIKIAHNTNTIILCLYWMELSWITSYILLLVFVLLLQCTLWDVLGVHGALHGAVGVPGLVGDLHGDVGIPGLVGDVRGNVGVPGLVGDLHGGIGVPGLVGDVRGNL